MLNWYDNKEVNTGRQREYDYLKGIFMILIYIIHAYQSTFSKPDVIQQVIYIFNSMSGAAIFIFVMGFGSVYSRNATPLGFVKSGVRLVIYQYLNNIAYVAALLLPFRFIIGTLSEVGRNTLKMLIPIYLQYTNIFFISGIIYLVLALLKKLNAHTIIYVSLGAVVSLAAPFIYGLPVLGYIVKLLIGEDIFVSFTPLYILPYALFSAAFARLFRRVNDKRKFYTMITPICAVTAVIWWVMIFLKNGTDSLPDNLVQPFELSGGSLYRISIYKTKDGNYLYMEFHHIICDGTSAAILVEDINSAYRGECIEAEGYTGFEAALDEEKTRSTEVYKKAKQYYDKIFDGVDSDFLPLGDAVDDTEVRTVPVCLFCCIG